MIDYTELKKQIENSYCSSKVSQSVALKLLKYLEESKLEGEIELKYKKLKSLTMIDIIFRYSFGDFLFYIHLDKTIEIYFKMKLNFDNNNYWRITSSWVWTKVELDEVAGILNRIKLIEEIYTKI